MLYRVDTRTPRNNVDFDHKGTKVDLNRQLKLERDRVPQCMIFGFELGNRSACERFQLETKAPRIEEVKFLFTLKNNC